MGVIALAASMSLAHAQPSTGAPAINASGEAATLNIVIGINYVTNWSLLQADELGLDDLVDPTAAALIAAGDALEMRDFDAAQAKLAPILRADGAHVVARALDMSIELARCQKRRDRCLVAADAVRAFLAASAQPSRALPKTYLAEYQSVHKADIDQNLTKLVIELFGVRSLMDTASPFATRERLAQLMIDVAPQQVDGYMSLALIHAEQNEDDEAIASFERARPFARGEEIADIDNALSSLRARNQPGFRTRRGWRGPVHLGLLAAFAPFERPEVVRQLDDDVTARGGSVNAPLAFTIGFYAPKLELAFKYVRTRGVDPTDGGFYHSAWGVSLVAPIRLRERGKFGIAIPIGMAAGVMATSYRIEGGASGFTCTVWGGIRAYAKLQRFVLLADATYAFDPGVAALGGFDTIAQQIMLDNGEVLDGGMGGPSLRLAVVIGMF